MLLDKKKYMLRKFNAKHVYLENIQDDAKCVGTWT